MTDQVTATPGRRTAGDGRAAHLREQGERAGEVRSADPGRLGLTAYTYFHVPMVAGIIVAAAGYELAIAHPGDQVQTATAWLIFGGPLSS